jgi:hypothetical protein
LLVEAYDRLNIVTLVFVPNELSQSLYHEIDNPDL